MKINKKTFFSKVVAVSLLSAMALQVSVFADGGKFTDIDNHWGKDAIIFATGAKFLGGYPDSTIRPDAPITKAELAVVVSKITKIKLGGETEFLDVEAGTWYYDYVVALTNAKIMVGTNADLFEPDKKMTREEVAVVMAKTYKLAPIENKEQAFKDDAKISKEALGYVKALKAKGLVKGDPAGDFNPKANVKRADFCQMIYNMEVLVLGKDKNNASTGEKEKTITSETKKGVKITKDTINTPNYTVKVIVTPDGIANVKYIGYIKTEKGKVFTDASKFTDITSKGEFRASENGFYVVAVMDSNHNYTFVEVEINNIQSENIPASPKPSPTPAAVVAKYKVTYHKGVGSASGNVTVDATEYTVGNNTVTVPGAGSGADELKLEITSNGTTYLYAFQYWVDQDDATKIYAAGDTFTITKNTTLRAVYDFALQYNLMGGTVANGYTAPLLTTNHKRGEVFIAELTTKTATAATAKLVKGTQVFKGWALDSAGTDMLPANGKVTFVDRDVMLFAIYEDTYKVNYITKGDAPATTDSARYIAGENYTIAAAGGNSTTPAFKFKHWGTSATDTTAIASASQRVMGTDNVDIHAVYEITITYDGNGATAGSVPVNQNVILGGTETLSSGSGLIKSGTAITAWNTAADGGGTTYALSTSVADIPSNITLYAKY